MHFHKNDCSESESEWALLPGIYTYEEFVFMTEATAAQQNDCDRTKNTDHEKKNLKEQ